MIKQRIFQLLVITLCCAVMTGCKHEVPQADESPMENSGNTTEVMNDSVKTDTSLIPGNERQDSSTSAKVSEAKETEVQQAETAGNDSAKNKEAQDGITNSEATDSAKQAHAVTDSISQADSMPIDSSLVDSLWRQLIVDIKVMGDSIKDDTKLETLNRDSVFVDSVFKKAQEEKLDSLVKKIIVPPSKNESPSEPYGWLNWMTGLAVLIGLLLGALLAWLVSWIFKRKKIKSEPKKEKTQLKTKDYSESDMKKRSKEFLKKLIIK